MTPVTKYAALRALAHGINDALADAAQDVAAFRALTGGKGFTTPFGEVSFRKNPPKITFDKAALLAWARDNMPHEVVEEHTIPVPAAVRPSLIKTLETRLVIVGGEVVDSADGEVVTFAAVQPAGEDSVVFTMSADQKAEAAALVAARVDVITASIAPQLDAYAVPSGTPTTTKEHA